mgnify:CR=1 FL=1|tara:strand:- start:348 stop:1373 length:1026 start_codon:yes stop_codon:yes gene_type:complete
MSRHDVFLSVIYVLNGNLDQLQKILTNTVQTLSQTVVDYEIVVVDNMTNKSDSIPLLKKLTNDKNFPNLQVYILNKRIDENIATCIGLDKSLGDFVTILNPFLDDISFVPTMLDEAKKNFDIVIAYNNNKYIKSFFYRYARKGFDVLYKFLNKESVAEDIYPYRLFSRRVTNQILQDQYPEMILRHLPTSIGYKRKELNYSSEFTTSPNINFLYSIKKGIKFLISTSNAPMRLVSMLSIFGALMNVVYSIYILVIAFAKTEVAEGWITLSLQQSGMFFLISIFFFILSEYILDMKGLKKNEYSNYISQEFGSSVISRHSKINLKEIDSSFSDNTNKKKIET